MKPCPQCGKLPLTVGQFLRKFDMRKAKCQNCGTLLKANRILYASFYSAIAFGACGAGLAMTLEEVYGWPGLSTLLAFVGAVLVVGIPAEIIGWRKGAYLIESKNGKTQPTDAVDKQ